MGWVSVVIKNQLGIATATEAFVFVFVIVSLLPFPVQEQKVYLTDAFVSAISTHAASAYAIERKLWPSSGL